MNLIILGPQGSGKGTQATMLAEKYNLAHIDVGYALRQHAKADTDYGHLLDEIINKKKDLVSDDLVSIVLVEELRKVPKEKGVILDGAPRRIGQVSIIEKVLADNGRRVDGVVYVNISEKESVIRISKRYNCTICAEGLIMGKDFHNINDPCHYCGARIEQRLDDTPDGVRKRLEIFNHETLPVIEHYRKQGLLLEVDGEKQPAKVFEEIEKSIGDLQCKIIK